MSEQEWTKEKVLDKITSGRKAFEQTLARVPEQDMEAPVLHDGWSVKDVLGHLGFWEGLTASRFILLRAGGMPEPFGDMDAVNARVLADTRRLSLEEVRRDERESYGELLGLVQSASPDELVKPGYFAWANEHPFVNWIAGDTWEHYEEHLPELRAWLDRDKKS
jgi:hypothetical protein